MHKHVVYISYALFGLPLAFFALPLYVYLPKLYSEQLGMSLTGIGVVLLVARLFDAVIDPWIGRWSDQHRQRRTVILIAIPFLLIGWDMLFIPPAGANLYWLALSLIIAYAAYSFANINYQAWGAEFPADNQARLHAISWREGAGMCGVILASIFPPLLGGSLAYSLGLMTVLFMFLLVGTGSMMVLFVPFSAQVPNRNASDQQPTQAPASIRKVWQAPAFVRLITVYAINGVAASIPATLVMFYVADVLEAEAWGGTFLLLYFLTGVLALPIWTGLAARYGRVNTWLIAMAIAMAGFVMAPFLGSGDVLGFSIVCIASGAALGADLALPSSLLAEHLAQEGDAGTGYGWWTAVTKLNLALAAGIALPLVSFLGYTPGIVDHGVHALRWVYGGLPLLLKLFAFVALWQARRILASLDKGNIP